MKDYAGEKCSHPEGVWVMAGSAFQCPVCQARLDLAGMERWVREAERARDEAYLMDKGDEFARVLGEERQQEVYRRRRTLYEVKRAPRGETARPEMILISYDAAEDAYECRLFYKGPRPVRGPERLGVAADLDRILDLRSHPDPNVRLASGKIEEFHTLRKTFLEQDTPPPPRRVYYSNDL